MILLNGCSFSYGTACTDPESNNYGKLLEGMLDEEVINISEPSKSNFYMAFEILFFISHKLSLNEELPRIIIWQHSDNFRDHVPDWRSSGSWKPNNLRSIVSNDFGQRFIKLNVWSALKQISDRVNSYIDLARKAPDSLSRDRIDQQFKEFKKRYGMGSYIVQNTLLEEQLQTRYLVGDETFWLNEFRHAVNVLSVQNMCKLHNIRLINYNYYGTKEEVITDPVFNQIDRSNYLIENSELYGMYNHLCCKGFDRPDNFHFNDASHLYQAELLYNFITNNTRLKVEETLHETLDEWPREDYTHPGEMHRRFAVQSFHRK